MPASRLLGIMAVRKVGLRWLTWGCLRVRGGKAGWGPGNAVGTSLRGLASLPPPGGGAGVLLRPPPLAAAPREERQGGRRGAVRRTRGGAGKRRALWAKGLPCYWDCGHTRALHAPLGCPGLLCAGRPPCKQGSVFGLLPCYPMVWLPRESGNPVSRVRATVSTPEGEKWSSLDPEPPL